MFASPALRHFQKTRTQHLSGRTENNHGTLVRIVGFRAGMKHKKFRICCMHHSMATCQPQNYLCNRIPFDTSLEGLFPHYAFTPLPHLVPNVCFFLQSLPLLQQQQSAVSPPGQLEYYAVAWGLTKVLLKE
jgi:hypothetical protein